MALESKAKVEQLKSVCMACKVNIKHVFYIYTFKVCRSHHVLWMDNVTFVVTTLAPSFLIGSSSV